MNSPFRLYNVVIGCKSLVASLCFVVVQVFVCGVVFCSQSQLLEKARINSGGPQQLYEPRCMPLPLLRLLSTDRQREWWEAVYSLIHKQAQ